MSDRRNHDRDGSMRNVIPTLPKCWRHRNERVQRHAGATETVSVPPLPQLAHARLAPLHVVLALGPRGGGGGVASALSIGAARSGDATCADSGEDTRVACGYDLVDFTLTPASLAVAVTAGGGDGAVATAGPPIAATGPPPPLPQTVALEGRALGMRSARTLVGSIVLGGASAVPGSAGMGTGGDGVGNGGGSGDRLRHEYHGHVFFDQQARRVLCYTPAQRLMPHLHCGQPE